MSTAAMAPRRSDGHLRGALLVALGALVLTTLVLSLTSSSSKATPKAPRDHHRHRVHTTVPGGATTTTVPGAVTGSVTRARAGGGCGLSLGGAAPSRATGGAPTGNSAGSDRAGAVGHCTVLEIGDSLGNDIGWGISRHISSATGLDFVQLDKSSTGLVDTSYFDWSSQLETDLHRVHPQLVVICLGGNDEQGMDLNGAPVQFPMPAWKAAYLERVRQLVSEATASGAYVLWIGMPIMQQPTYSAGMETLNALYEKGTTSEPDATFVPVWSLFSNPQGGFQSSASVNGTATTLREPDGIHYSFAGEDVVATYVLREMALVYHVHLSPTDPATVTSWG